MKNIPTKSRLYFVTLLTLTLTACGGGGGGGGTTSNPPTPYPSASNASVFPTKIDTLEGTLGGDDTPATATSTTIGATSYHTIYPLEDVDWVAVSLNAGTQYEFTVDNASYNGYPLLELYTASDTASPLSQDYGYFASNPRILYTPGTSGTYYLKVSDYAGGVDSYTLSSRIFSDGDSDGYSPYYDCDDTVATGSNIFPWQVDIQGDGIDQSCSGYDWPLSTLADILEPDNAFITAGSLPMFGGDPFDIIHRGDNIYAPLSGGTHTLELGDIDTFKVTVPAYSAYEIFDVETNGVNFNYTLYAADQTTVIDAQTSSAFIYEYLDNTGSATPSDFYLQINTNIATETATYTLGVGDIGSDADGDGHFTHSQGLGWDCDDSDALIHGGAAETIGDGIDSNCNGKDDT